MMHVMSLASVYAALGAGVALAGCALGIRVPVHTSPTELQFDAIPDSADVRKSGESMGTTLLKLALHPNQEYTVMYRKEGCTDLVVTFAIRAQVGWGNS